MEESSLQIGHLLSLLRDSHVDGQVLTNILVVRDTDLAHPVAVGLQFAEAQLWVTPRHEDDTIELATETPELNAESRVEELSGSRWHELVGGRLVGSWVLVSKHGAVDGLQLSWRTTEEEERSFQILVAASMLLLTWTAHL